MSSAGRSQLPGGSTERSTDRTSGASEFAERLLTVLADGAFTSTYKYAVLLGLVDLCVEQSTRTGGAPTSVTTRQLAERILELYWPQVRLFDERLLQQNSGNQAAILTRILRFQNEVGEPGISVARARHLAPDEFARLVRDIEWTLVEMPLPKLQRVGSEQVHFLYRINWSDDIRRSTFMSPDFDNAIRFIGNAGEDLVRLAPFVRPLVQREWSGLVARFNGLAEARLEQFLFGASREAIAHLAEPLLQLQDGSCFYCGRRVRQRREVDHFVPWSRHPDNGLDNLVVTDAACNNAKRDHLAAAEHVERWAERNRQREVELAQIADVKQWSHRPRRTLSVARSIYLRLPADARLWQIQREFVSVDAPRLRSVLGAVS